MDTHRRLGGTLCRAGVTHCARPQDLGGCSVPSFRSSPRTVRAECRSSGHSTLVLRAFGVIYRNRSLQHIEVHRLHHVRVKTGSPCASDILRLPISC